MRHIKVLLPEHVRRRVLTKEVSRRSLLVGLGAGVLGASALSGCASTSFAASAQPDGQLEAQLNVYSWGDYDDPAVIDEFSAGRSTRVQMDSFASNEELIAKLGATRGTSGYDVIVPTSSYLDLMSENRLLEKLDLSRIPNAANLDTDYAGSIADPDNAYAVCKNWGTTGFLYDSSVINRELSSWADFLDCAQKEASGRVSLLDDAMEVGLIYLAAHNQDPASTDPRVIEEATAFLVDKIAPNVRAFSSTPGTYVIQRSMALVHAYNGDARRSILDSEDPDVWRWVYPTPTANRWMDMWAIPAGAQNIDAAYAFIDYMLEPDVAIRDVDYIGYSTGLKGQQQLAEEEEFDLVDLLYPPEETVKALTSLKLNDATEAWISMLSQMQAKAGA